MLDTNCPWSVRRGARDGRGAAPFDLYWLEEPVWPPEDHAGLAKVRAARRGDRGRRERAGLIEFRRAFELGALDFAQPSVTKIGGISEMRRIIALAHEFGVRVVPHCRYFGPGFIASLH